MKQNCKKCQHLSDPMKVWLPRLCFLHYELDTLKRIWQAIKKSDDPEDLLRGLKKL